MTEEQLKIIKSIVALNKIADKLEQRISSLEKVLESHAKCIGRLAHEKENKHECNNSGNSQNNANYISYGKSRHKNHA